MAATWAVARAAVRRRRTQTALIGVIVTLCTATLLVGLALLAAVTGPFDRTFGQLNGAHATVLFDSAKVADDRVATAPLRRSDGSTMGGPMRIAGRPEPGGPVDGLRLTSGRWARTPGEIVLGAHVRFGPTPQWIIGQTFTVPNAGTVTVVGLAYSVTQ